MNQLLVFTILVSLSGPAAAVAQPSKIYRLEELTWPQIDALDRERTLFILPAGMIEEHGPHLPVGADTLGVMYEADATSRRVSRALPDWTVVMMPPVNYGQGGANVLGDMLIHPGTYSIRQSTVRALIADIGAQVAQNRFKWIFVLNGHGAPTHNIAINDACDFVSETFGVTMLHLSGLFRADAAIQAAGEKVNAKHFSASDLSSFGMDVHAGVSETSAMLAVRPDLVRSNYKELPSRAGNSFEELRDIAIAQGWQGYLSSPAKATAAHGRALESWWIDGFTDLIVRAIRGEKMLGRPRVPETVPAAVAPVLERALATEAAFEAALEQWLAQRGPRASSRASQRQDSASEIRRQPSGSFRFVDSGTNHPIIVWFCRTPRIAPDTRVVFVMHGGESETARQACDIAASYIQSHNAIVLAPQFAEAYYPGDAYVFGNVLDASGRSLPKSAWALTAIERVFDVVRDELGLSLSDYDIVGFSGGAQFVHRLALFVPDARYRRAVAASAGRYAFPSWAETFPFGLAGSPIDRTALTSVFSRELVVLLGDRDVTDRERDSDSMAQGKTRFARGLRFFATALDEASALGINLRWTLRIVHGVDHSPTQMVRAALEELDRQP